MTRIRSPQAADLYRLMTAEEQQRLVDNSASGLDQCSAEVQDHILPHCDKCDPEYGHGVRESVGRMTKRSVNLPALNLFLDYHQYSAADRMIQ
jgi:catalase